jgi:hypothetical protein
MQSSLLCCVKHLLHYMLPNIPSQILFPPYLLHNKKIKREEKKELRMKCNFQIMLFYPMFGILDTLRWERVEESRGEKHSKKIIKISIFHFPPFQTYPLLFLNKKSRCKLPEPQKSNMANECHYCMLHINCIALICSLQGFPPVNSHHVILIYCKPFVKIK